MVVGKLAPDSSCSTRIVVIVVGTRSRANVDALPVDSSTATDDAF
jgi:hypothetical protein